MKIIDAIAAYFRQDKKGYKADLASLLSTNNIFSFQNHEQIDSLLSTLKEKHKLSQNTYMKIYRQHACKIFGLFVEQITNKEPITNDEAKQLKSMADILEVTNYQGFANKFLDKVILGAISDNKLTQEEASRLKEITTTLGVNNYDEMMERLSPYREMAEPLKSMSSKIMLPQGEYCYLSFQTALHEYRKQVEKVGYSGPRARIKIAKGFYYTFGSTNLSVKSKDVMTQIDEGILYFTNKRIIFDGSKGNKVYKPAQIINFEMFKNGLQLEKSSGKSPFFSFQSNLRTNLLVDRLFRECYFPEPEVES